LSQTTLIFGRARRCKEWDQEKFVGNGVLGPMARHLTLSDFKIQDRFPVHWGDMDSARHVNNLVYLRWAETVRVAYFEAMGMNVDFSGDAAGPILAWQDCKYIFPMTFPDVALVGARVTEIAEDRFTLETGIFSERQERIAAITKQVIVPYNYAKLTKVPLPVTWVEGIKGIEG
ncbi:MAG: acyl-CoA thioesterase, partial [Bacteroidota bacterium]